MQRTGQKMKQENANNFWRQDNYLQKSCCTTQSEEERAPSLSSLSPAKIIELDTHVSLWQSYTYIYVYMFDSKEINISCRKEQRGGGWFLKLLRLRLWTSVCVCVWKIQWQRNQCSSWFQRREMMAEAFYIFRSLQWHERRPPLWDTILHVVRNGIQIKWLQF